MEKLYTTNNIVKSLNSRINFYLPKGITSKINFVNSISKFIINEEYIKNNNNKVNRHDYITKTFLKIVNSKLYYPDIKWITYKEFLEYEKLVIKDVLKKFLI